MFNKNSIPKLIVIFPILMIFTITFVSGYFYIKTLREYTQKSANDKIKTYISTQIKENETLIQNIGDLVKYLDSTLEKNMKDELKERIDLAYKSAHYLYNKYKDKKSEKEIKEKIEDSLSQMLWEGKQNYVFITSYEGDNILSANPALNKKNLVAFEDADGRAVIIEEIVKVRKYTQGYIKTTFFKDKGEQILFVKDLGFYDWFVGSGIHFKIAKNKIKNKFLDYIKSISLDSHSFIKVYDQNKTIYSSKNLSKDIDRCLNLDNKTWAKLNGTNILIYKKEIPIFNWSIIFGFDTKEVKDKAKDELIALELKLEKETKLIFFGSLLIALFVSLLSFLLSRKIISIFKEYEKDVKQKQEELELVNYSLELRVKEEVQAHQEKEKMLIQNSKMAAMGDMISMIAHQWRQPLNQLSYIFMNIEGAYDDNDLSKEYLKKKISEGEKTLEFMSSTIDDFRNFFMPDKDVTSICLNEIAKESIKLTLNMLKNSNIEIFEDYKDNAHIKVYKNELLQVVLNLIKNSKDALLENSIKNPYIKIKTYQDNKNVYLVVCDNAKGIDEDISQKIFEPYFSTKESSSGTGLGLYMSKTIVETHLKGKLVFNNTKDGVCFIISLRIS